MEEKQSVFEKFAEKLTKNRLIAVNILICMAVAFCIVFGLISIFSYAQPKNLQKATGNIAKFEQHDTQWYDYIGGVTGSYLRITFEDGTYFEATGICYDNIDRKLFEIAGIGEEIEITYEQSFTRPNRIYAIEYDGDNYLFIDDVLRSYKNESKTSQMTGGILIGVSVIVGGVIIFIVNYRHGKKNSEN